MNIAIALWIALVLFTSHMKVGDNNLVSVLAEHDVIAEQTERGVVIYIPEITFASNASQITDTPRAAIQSVVDVLHLNGVRHRFAYFEGHTDEYGSHEFNLVLGQNRAEEVMEEFHKAGLSSRRTKAVSYGETLPKSDTPTENRRVDILLIDKE